MVGERQCQLQSAVHRRPFNTTLLKGEQDGNRASRGVFPQSALVLVVILTSGSSAIKSLVMAQSVEALGACEPGSMVGVLCRPLDIAMVSPSQSV
jgi:hypothetical protein